MIRSLFYKEIKERKMALVLGLVLCLAPPVVMGIIRLFSRLSPAGLGHIVSRDFLGFLLHLLCDFSGNPGINVNLR